MSNIPSSLSPSRVSVQWHDVSVSSFSPGKAHSIVCHQCFTCDMILLNLFSWLCWVIVVARKIVLETSQLSPWHAVSGVWELQCLQLCRFSYSVAYGMLVSQSAIEPSSPTLQGGCLTTEPPGKALWHALSACFYTLYQKTHCLMGLYHHPGLQSIWHASRTSSSTLVKHNQVFITMQHHSMQCASSLITRWTLPIDYHDLLFQCNDTSSYSSRTLGQTHPVVYLHPVFLHPVKAVTCFQCFFIHPRSNVLSSLSLSTL